MSKMGKQLFAGTGTLLRFLFRRDRLRLPIWILGLSGFTVVLVPVFTNLLTSGSENMLMAEMLQNPAMVAIVGPVYGADNYHTGAAFANMMLLFCAMLAGVMSIFLITRHTRHDEELGRLEVIRSLPVGRLANLGSALLAALISNALLAALTCAGLFILREEGMDFGGCLLFGLALGATGMFFALATALFCQATANNRTASGMAYMLLMLLYIMRAMGDIGPEALSLASPLGLVLRTQCFVNNYWWPLGWMAAICALLFIIVMRLAMVRDLGRGFVAERQGRSHAGALLSSPFGLALRLARTSLIVWLATIFVFAAAYGSVFGELDSFISGNELLSAIFAADSDFSLAEQFIVMLMSIMSMIATIPVISFIGRIASEEKRGHTEHLFGRAVSRGQQMAAYASIAFASSIAFQFLTALGFWSSGSMVLDTTPSLGTFSQAAFAYLPAIWFMMGVAMLLVALLPGKTAIAYGWLGYSFFSVYLGVVMNLPDWLAKLTPFGYIPRYPVEELELTAPLVLAAMAFAFAGISFAMYRKRDLQTQ